MWSSAGLAWSGAFWGNGSGDTANRAPYDPDQDLIERRVLASGRIDRLFPSAADATRESVLNALAATETIVGRHGYRRIRLAELLDMRGQTVPRRRRLVRFSRRSSSPCLRPAPPAGRMA